MSYNYINFSQMKTELANRLDDYSKIYWVDAELGFYLQESMRTWQALTGTWRNRMTFNTAIPTSPPNFWYDLTSQAGSVIPYTLKDRDLISVMMYHLIEPQLSGATYVGSDQFTLADIVQALQQRRDQFLVETGMVTGQQFVNSPAPPISRIALPDNVIDVRRAAWYDVPTGKFSTLYKSDEWAAESFFSAWATSAGNPPQNFSIAASPPVTLQLIPPPSNVAQVELITVNAGAALNPVVGVLLGIPDNFAHVIKWGALADLLGREGQPNDVMRASYCDQRWKEGVFAGRLHTSVMTAYLNGVQTFPESIHSLSSYRAGWQNLVGPPDILGLMSWNLVAINPTDTNGPYSVMMDVVCNAPVPILDADQVQVAREELDAILSYAQHLAAFKQGGQEFTDSAALYMRMVELAQVRNARLRAAVPFYDPLSDRALIQERQSARREPIETQ